MNRGLDIFKQSQRGRKGVRGYQGGEGNVGGGGYTPYQQGLIDRMNSGGFDYTFGPGSPNPTREDYGTYMGGPHSPAGGFAQEGGYALAPSDYYSFTPEQRRELGIMDIAPSNQAGQLERYYGSGGSGGTSTSGGGGGYPNWPGGLELRNALGYNPSYPYGSFGSGVPTRKAFGALGNIIGGGVGGAAVPGLGNIVGGGVGGRFGSWLGKLFNNWRMNQGSGTTAPAKTPPATTTDTGDDTASAGGGGRGFFDRWSASGTPGVGVGISPTGAPAVGREWWSPDFGRWNVDKGGDFPGSYNLEGPGGSFGTKGLPGGHTVQNFSTAIGFGGNLGGGIGAGNLENLWGGRMARPSAGPMTAEQWGSSGMGRGQAGGQLASFIAGRGGAPAPSYQNYLSAWQNAPNLAALLPQFSGEVNRGTPLRRNQ